MLLSRRICLNDHPNPVALAGFVWNRVPSGSAKAIVSHLLQGCEKCLAEVAPHLAGLLGQSEPPANVLSPDEDAQYEAAIGRAFTTALGWSKDPEEESWCAEASLNADAALEGLPDIPPDLEGVPLFEALLKRSLSLRHENPEEMVRFAEWARVLAERLRPEQLGVNVLADLQCRAWIELGNSLRVADNLLEADRALGRATELFLQGTQDELIAARLFDIEASILGDLRRFDLAATALDLVFAIYYRYGDYHLAGRALITRGLYVGYDGDSAKSVDLIEQGLSLLDEERDPRLFLIALHNQARAFMECGQLRDARMALWKLKARGLGFDGRVNELKIRWLEGQINAGLGELDRAETALQEVMLGFEEAGLPYKAALAGLELGLVMFRRGNADAAIQEVLAAVHVFLSLGIAREVSASVLLLRKAIDRELLNLEFLEYVIEQLHRIEGGRGAFEPTMDE
jgi:tetratricopeptide (TPR) repeat protein